MTDRTTATGLGRPTVRLLAIAAVLALLHHADHVLRVDHSGWPFRRVVTPFTFSLLAYPTILFALLGPRRLFWWRWVILATAAGFTLFAHSVVESPEMQYAMWALNRSIDPTAAPGLRNLLDICSPTMGWIAVGIGMALNVTVIVAVAAMLRDGVRASRR